MALPFEVPFHEVARNLDAYVDEVFACLESEFLVMPKGRGFVEYSTFQGGYEALKRATEDFRNLIPEKVTDCVSQFPIALIVLRAILGFSPSEWAYVATRRTSVQVSQTAARNIDRKIRLRHEKSPASARKSLTTRRIMALVRSGCEMINEGAPLVADDKLHRLN